MIHRLALVGTAVAALVLVLLACHPGSSKAPRLPVQPVVPARIVAQLGPVGVVDQMTWIDDRYLVTGGQDGTLRLWDSEARVLQAAAFTGGRTTALASIEGGLGIASASDDGSVSLWGGNGLQPLWRKRVGATLVALAFDGTSLWGVAADKTLFQLDVRTGSVKARNPKSGVAAAAAFDFQNARVFIADPTNDAIEEFDLAEFKRRRNLLGQSRINDIDLAPNGMLGSCGTGDDINLWDLESGQIVETMRAPGNEIESVRFSEDGSILVAAMPGGAASFDVATAALQTRFRADETDSVTLSYIGAISPDGAAVAWSNSGDVRLARADGTNDSALLTERLDPVVDVAVSTDGHSVGVLDGTGTTNVWSLENLRFVGPVGPIVPGARELRIGPNGAFEAPTLPATAGQAVEPSTAASLDGEIVASISEDGRLLVTHGSQTQSWTFDPTPSAVAVHDKGESVAVGSGSSVIVIELESGQEVYRNDAHAGRVTALGFGSDRLVSGSRDSTVAVHVRGGNGWSMAVTLVVRDREWLAFDHAGHFAASGAASNLGVMIDHGQAFRLEQVASKNRPHELLQALGSNDARLRDHLAARAQSRKDTGTTAVEIRDATARQDGDRVTIRGTVEGNATSAITYVNGVPVESNARIDGTSFELEIALGAGSNHLEYGLVDAQGRESARRALFFQSRRSIRARTLHVLAIGVSDYADDRLDLDFAQADATAVAELFRSVEGSLAVPNVRVRVLGDADAGRVGIEEAGAAFFAQADIDDIVVLFVAGHGTYAGGIGGQYYFLPHDVDPTSLETTGVSYDSLIGVLGRSPARHRFALLDTCESGERPQDARRVPPPPGATPRTVRGLEFSSAHATAPRRIFRRDRFIYEDLERRTGAIVMSAAQGDEASLEFVELGHGVFTWALQQALASGRSDLNRDGATDPDELLRAVVPLVRERTAGQQTPTIDRHNRLADFAFPPTKP